MSPFSIKTLLFFCSTKFLLHQKKFILRQLYICTSSCSNLMLTCCYNGILYYFVDVLYAILKSMHSKLVCNILLLVLIKIISYNCDHTNEHFTDESLGRKYEARKTKNIQPVKTKQGTKETKNKFRSINRRYLPVNLG